MLKTIHSAVKTTKIITFSQTLSMTLSPFLWAVGVRFLSYHYYLQIVLECKILSSVFDVKDCIRLETNLR